MHNLLFHPIAGDAGSRSHRHAGGGMRALLAMRSIQFGLLDADTIHDTPRSTSPTGVWFSI